MTPLRVILEGLEQTRSTENFLLRYGLRNPPRGRGLGPKGVENEALVASYAEALEGAYQHLVASGWEHPNKDSQLGKVPVYIFDTTEFLRMDAAFTMTQKGG